METKSVSQLTSTSAPVVPSTAAATTPSAVMREAALPALLPSLTRRISSARPMSPSASVSAFLHSIIGASVLARSSATMLAVIAGICVLRSMQAAAGTPPARRPVKQGGRQPRAVRGRGRQRASGFFADFDELVAAGDAACTTSLVALALPSSTASATARAYSATALAESSLPGMT